MRYYGGGIGHLKNTLPQQSDSLIPNSGEVAAPENEENKTERDEARDILTQDVVMRSEESMDENHDADNEDESSTDPENYDHDKNNEIEDEDEDEGDTSSSDEDDSSGYASP